MASGFRDRIKQAMAEAEAKAATMTDAEIDARLGPATRTFFAASERLEAGTARNMANSWRAFCLVVIFVLGGFFAGQAITTLIATTPHTTATFPILVGGLFISLALIAYTAMAWARRKGSDVGYVPGFLGMIAASAGSNGDMWTIAVAAGAMVGGVIAGLIVPLYAPTDVHMG